MLTKISLFKCNNILKVPEYLIYHKVNKYSSFSEDCFLLFSTKNPSVQAIMYCTPEEVYRKDKGWINSLYVSYLDTFGNKYKGLGTMLLNLAKKWSENLGYEGRFHVFASSIKPSDTVAHVFYRKYGMNTGSPEFDKKLEIFAKENKLATNLDFKPKEMFYPPIEYNVKNKSSFLKNVIKSIISYFRIVNTPKGNF